MTYSGSRRKKAKYVYLITFLSVLGGGISVYYVLQPFDYFLESIQELLPILSLFLYAVSFVIGIIYSRYRLADLKLEEAMRLVHRSEECQTSEQADFLDDLNEIVTKLANNIRNVMLLQRIVFLLAFISTVVFLSL